MIFHSLLLVDAGNTRVKWAVVPRAGRDPEHVLPSSPAILSEGEMLTSEATPERIRELKKNFAGCYLVLASVVPKLTLPRKSERIVSRPRSRCIRRGSGP
jgi:pantothenate kinase type III